MSQIILQNTNAIAKPPTYNIRSEGLSSNNTLVFSWKESPKYFSPIEWYVISIPAGDYTIEEINNKFAIQIKYLTGDNHSNIIISPVENSEISSITITSPSYIVDIYRSSIRIVLGWPETEIVSNQVFFPRVLKWKNSVYGDGVHMFNFAASDILYV